MSIYLCNIRGMFVNRILYHYDNKSLKRFFGSNSNGSYVHNPGSESLQYTTVGATVAQTAHAHPARIALRSLHEDLTLTYEELLTQADALGYALRDQGLEKGDRVGLWSHNSAAYIIGIIAAARAGLVAVTINSLYEKPELEYCIKKTGLKCLLIGDKLGKKDYYHLLSKQVVPELNKFKLGSSKSDEFPILSSVITVGNEKKPGTFSYDSLIDAYKKHAHKMSKYDEEISPDEGCLIHFTSGTTGHPRAALDSHFGIVNNTYFSGKTNTLHEMHHKVCVQVPIFHALGSVTTVLGAFRHGCTLVLAGPMYSVNSTMKALYEEKCSFITGTPTMYVDLVNSIRTQGTPPPNLKIAVTAGAPCNHQLISHLQKYLKTHPVNMYGMTETTAGIFQSVPGDSVDLVAETVGRLQDHIEVKVVNDEGNLVPFGTPGELLVRGYSNMLRYLNEPEKTDTTLGKDNWLRTGDKFILSADGYGRIVGRLKEIIVRGGENIAPKEIEAVLDTHPDIIESQVVGVSDERLGEELCAVVRLREGVSLDAAAVVRHCGGRLATFKIPRLLKLIHEFPKTASGKIQKYKLREMVESGKL